RGKPPAEASAGAVAAVSVERRAGAKGNTHQQSTSWTQNQARVSQALERIRQLVPSHTRGRRSYGAGGGGCGTFIVHTNRWRLPREHRRIQTIRLRPLA